MEIKKTNLIAIGLIAIFAFTASKPKKQKKHDLFKEVSHRFYASSYEVSNKEFRDYLNDIRKSKPVEFEANFPDSTQWVKRFEYSFNEPWSDKYFWHPGFDKYPVVNITQKAAKDYCQWLTEKYNSSEKREFKKVLFRLPTEQEWN